ncbi:hypothetical protein [Mesorhizobium sp. B2-5-3]|uniref:hypothetical protein n=1 Tax=Mesorhizobium sp. B2-5-3 TaxID=2589927 RepID=UPI00112C03DE|nr:hypothetical protein [Mesorhizobium sp. B2-5-3]TPK38068.1 hypothetical protein FJ867_12465 [Mesorhizobium sp. B2-5-3]
MIESVEEDELPSSSPTHRWQSHVRATALIVAPVISIASAALAGYFSYAVINTKPPTDMSELAISILKSGDASPEMQAWATDTLGIQTDIPMVLGSIKPVRE